MTSINEKGEAKTPVDSTLKRAITSSSVQQGEVEAQTTTGDAEDFYGGAINENYIRKSELIAKHLSEIGTGR